MKKIVKIVIILIIIAVVAWMIFHTQKASQNGNMSNMGLVVQYKGVTYYNKYEKGIFAVKKGKETQMTDETAYSLNVMDGKIYYLTVEDFNHVVIKSVNIKTKEIQKIAVVYTSNSKFFVNNKGIYYMSNEDGGVCKIDINGENDVKLVNEKVQDFQVYDNKIFFINSKNKICKADISGENSVVLNDEVTAEKIQIVDSWIYYYSQPDEALFRLSKNGKKQELISTLVKNETYNVTKKYVYYFDSENQKIARMRIRKSNKCDDIVTIDVLKTRINLAGNELYYLDKSSDDSQTYQMHRIKTNGKVTNDIIY